MTGWQWILIVTGMVLFVALLTLIVWVRRTGVTATQAYSELRATGLELVRLPGRLRRLAGDERVPTRARWTLVGLAIYIASPIDPIPDFLPLIGHLDEVLLVPIILMRARAIIPPDVWDDYFPKRSSSSDRVKDAGQ